VDRAAILRGTPMRPAVAGVVAVRRASEFQLNSQTRVVLRSTARFAFWRAGGAMPLDRF
jgi:hypothetical protein